MKRECIERDLNIRQIRNIFFADVVGLSILFDQNASVASSDLRTDRLRKKARTDKIMRNIPKHRNNIISDLLFQK